MSSRNKIEILIDVARGAGFGAGLEALRLLTGAVTDFTKTAVVESVKVAAAYEKSRNTLEVYTGSLRRANVELAELTELARNTRGLSLRDAEEGTVRLRGLGFAAKTARDLVAGISLNKALSGSDEGAVNRVLQNLEQLKAGSPQANRDIRQMVLAIPTLSKVINESFGSIEKFQAAIKKNPGEALEQFAEAAAKTKVGNAGLSDSIIKLQNEFETAQRLFGEPLLEPLTESVQSLSKYLQENAETWKSWGTVIGDVLRGINAPKPESLVPEPQQSKTVFGDIFDSKFQYKTQGEIYEAYKAGKLQGYVDYSQKSNALTIRNLIGAANDGADSLTGMSKLKEYQQAGQNRRMISEGMKRLRSDGTIDFSEFSGGKTAKEREADEKAAQDGLNEERERGRLADLASLKRNSDAATALLKARYDNAQALLDSSIRYTDKEEAEYLSRSAQIKQNFYASERGRINGYYSKLIALTENGSEAQLKAQADYTKELAKLNSQEVQDAYRAKRQILEFEKRVQDERRQNLIKFGQIQVNETQQSAAKQLFEIQKGLEQGAIGYETYFSRQKEIADSGLKSLLELNRKNLDLELQDKSLTFEEIRNLRRESALEEQRLTQENAERNYQIEKDSIERRKDLLNDYFQGVQQTLESRRTAFDLLNNLVFGSQSTGRGSDKFLQSFSETQSAQIKSFTDKIDSLNLQNDGIKKLLAARAGGDLNAGDTLQKILDSKGIENPPTIGAGIDVILGDNEKLINAFDQQRVAIVKVRDELSPTVDKMKQLRASYDGTAEGVDRLRESILKQQQENERSQLAEQIEYQEKIVDKYAKDEAQSLKENLKLTQLKQAYTNLGLKQLDEQNELYKKSIDGLKAYNQALAEGDAQAVGFVQNAAKKAIYEEQGALLENNIALQERLNAVGQDSAARYKNAWLNATIAVREANIQAVESQIQSQVKLADSTVLHVEQIRAKVLDGLAQAKTINDVFAESILKTNDLLADKLNKSLGKVGDVPIIGDLLKFGNQQVASNLTKNLLDKFFPSEITDLFDKEKNPIASPIVEQQKITNKLLSQMSGGVRNGDVIDGVVQVVASDQKGGGLLDKIKSLFLGGGFGSITGGRTYGSGQNPNNPLIFHANDGGGSRPFGSGAEEIARQLRLRQTGEDYPDNGRGGDEGGGGLFGGKFGKNAGTAAGIGSLATLAGNAIGGRFGGILSSAGMGAQFGANFGFHGALIGAAIGAGIGIFKAFRGGDAEGKLRKAAKNKYGVDISDKGVLKTLKAIGESQLGKITSDALAMQAVMLPDAVELIQSFADGKGIKGNSALNINRITDENYKENYSRSTFSGFNSSGGVGLSSALSIPQSSFSLLPQSSVNLQGGLSDKKLDAVITLLNSIAKSNDEVAGNTGLLQTASPHDIVTRGALTAGRELADSVESEIYNGGSRRAEKFNKAQGII